MMDRRIVWRNGKDPVSEGDTGEESDKLLQHAIEGQSDQNNQNHRNDQVNNSGHGER